MGVPLAAVHGLLYVGSFFAAGLTMFLLVRAVTGRLDAGLFAGILFAFYPYRFSTFSHLEMQGVFLMPLALYFLLRTLDAGRVRDGSRSASRSRRKLVVAVSRRLPRGRPRRHPAVRWLGGHFRRDRA